ncbi:serine hydrolase domain-containing protein [Paenibacillus qinlingensis]|uniref:CubicO group peptidase (Beta-lactamase class C family) n=1 Tax=Paenibacillus qinlingensis TaxID=1837343 RepID=A0ABU1P264_9BACL|nr:serine hydrolase domain-containing protein [Paenibacillus qinlingensis]MDR6553322.1 CubicO group peptidase (beta-lactamase class C family) [Paenibacillus qinlingensis]
MSNVDIGKISFFIEQEIAAGHIPGAVLSIIHKGNEVLKEAYGSRVVYPETAPMRSDTVFDLASLTKVVATMPAVLQLMDQGKLSLGDPIGVFLPEFQHLQEEPIRIMHLLTHSSGLRADIPGIRGMMHLSRDELVDIILNERPVHPPGTKVMYSDIGMILLYLIVESVTGEAFDTYLKRELYEPLEMLETGFCPIFDDTRYAITEYSEQRQAYKSGIVHDEKAELMGGVSGHAGLFSTVHDLTNYAKMIRQQGIFKGRRIVSRAAIELMTHNFTPYNQEHRGLGWMLNHQSSFWFGGDYVSEYSFGHTGFTGTSLLFDPKQDLQIILLTNRVHFGRTEHILRIRPRLHNLILSQIE